MIQATETKRGIELSFSYNPQIVTAIRTIEGRRWDPVHKVWIVPKSSEDSLHRVLKMFGAEKTTSSAPEQFGPIPELPELDIEIPLNRPLFPFQSKGVAYILKHKRVICGDEPGLGKTSQAIAVITAANAFPCLIICPSTLKDNWKKEWMTVAGKKAIVLSNRVKHTWQQYYKTGLVDVFIINYESLKKFFVEKIDKPEKGGLRLNHIHFKNSILDLKAVAFDEGHRCKDGSTQQSKFVMGICKGKEWIIDLTGTPVVNKPKDLIAQLHILGRLGEFGGYKYFMDRYCGGNGSGATNLKELHYKLATTCFYRRKKSEVLNDLPDKVRQIVYCDITNRAEYNEALADLARYLKVYKSKTDPEVQRSMRGEAMVKIGVCKNIAARGKIPHVVEYMQEITEAGEKVAIFIHQKEITRALKEHFPKALTITGDDPIHLRQGTIDRFQNNPEEQEIICGIKAAGVGVTLTAASRAGAVELPWHAADADQIEDRFHRIGQKNSVHFTYFIGKDTIDEWNYELIESKRGVADTITGNQDDIQRMIIDKVMDSLFKDTTEEL